MIYRLFMIHLIWIEIKVKGGTGRSHGLNHGLRNHLGFEIILFRLDRDVKSLNGICSNQFGVNKDGQSESNA